MIDFNEYDNRIKERVKFLKMQPVDIMTPEILRKISDLRQFGEEEVRLARQVAERLNKQKPT